MKLHDSKKPLLQGIQFMAHAKSDITAEATSDIDSIDSCNLLALTYAEHSCRASVTRVSLRYLTLYFQNKDKRDDFWLKLQIAKGKRNEQLLSKQIGENTAKKNAIKEVPRSLTGSLSVVGLETCHPLRRDSARKDSLPVLPEVERGDPFQVLLGAGLGPWSDSGEESND
jgi:hypothetical protein